MTDSKGKRGGLADRALGDEILEQLHVRLALEAVPEQSSQETSFPAERACGCAGYVCT